MTDEGWIAITGTDADPLIGDSEIIAVHFRGERGLTLDLENGFPDGPRTSQLRFLETRFVQLANEGIHYLEGIEIFDRVADVLAHPEMGPYLRGAYGADSYWLRAVTDAPDAATGFIRHPWSICSRMRRFVSLSSTMSTRRPARWPCRP